MEAQKVLGCFLQAYIFLWDLVLVERLCKQDAEDIMAYLADVFPAGSRSRRCRYKKLDNLYGEIGERTQIIEETAEVFKPSQTCYR